MNCNLLAFCLCLLFFFLLFPLHFLKLLLMDIVGAFLIKSTNLSGSGNLFSDYSDNLPIVGSHVVPSFVVLFISVHHLL